MTHRNWFNAIVCYSCSLATVVSVMAGLPWPISWAFAFCCVVCAVDLAYCVYQEMKGNR